MPTPLILLDAAHPPAETWAAFLAQRDALTDQMEMATCNGCDGCGLRCMDGFTVTSAEYDAVAVYLASQPESEVRRIREQNKTVPWPGGEEFGVTVTFCRYRDMERGNCSVYPARPTVCRMFGHTDWLPCPIEAVQTIPADGRVVWSAYGAFEHRTWDDWKAVNAVENSFSMEEKAAAVVLPALPSA